MDPRNTLIVTFLVICVIFSGCTAPLNVLPFKEPTELMRSSWNLVSYYDDSNHSMVTGNPYANITVQFGKNGNVSGFINGCRKYSGHYKTMGETISVTNLSDIPDNKCPLSGESAVMENTYFSLLQKSPRFDINADTLLLGYFDANRYLVFTRI